MQQQKNRKNEQTQNANKFENCTHRLCKHVEISSQIQNDNQACTVENHIIDSALNEVACLKHVKVLAL